VANYFLTIPASDACIEFMRRNPDSLESFCAGEQPEPPFAAAPRPSLWNRLRGRAVAGDAVAVPSDWPTEEADLVGEINHRNVDLYHWVLNGTPEPVPGAGSVFQTWFADTHDAIDLFDDNERFAFDSGRTRELHRLAVTVTRDQTGERFRLWLAGRGHTAEVSDGEVDGVWEDFAAFRDLVGSSVERGWGLIWVPS
jgi:hypothetical protein